MDCMNCTKKATHGTRDEDVAWYCATCAKAVDLLLRNLANADCQYVGCTKYACQYIDDEGEVVDTRSKNLATFCKEHAKEAVSSKEEAKSAKSAAKKAVSPKKRLYRNSRKLLTCIRNLSQR